MNYEKFPFGKYKGQILSDLPNTYIVYALEAFELPEELTHALQNCLLENLAIDYPNSVSFRRLDELYKTLVSDYNTENGWSKDAVVAINDFRERLIEASI